MKGRFWVHTSLLPSAPPPPPPPAPFPQGSFATEQWPDGVRSIVQHWATCSALHSALARVGPIVSRQATPQWPCPSTCKLPGANGPLRVLMVRWCSHTIARGAQQAKVGRSQGFFFKTQKGGLSGHCMRAQGVNQKCHLFSIPVGLDAHAPPARAFDGPRTANKWLKY